MRSPGPAVAKLTDVMSRPVQVATPGQRLSEVDAFFAARQYSGLPVVDDDGRCVGVISNKDKAKAPNGVGYSSSFDHSLLHLVKIVRGMKKKSTKSNLFMLSCRDDDE